jgi:predicted transcriptional regulator
MKSKEGTITVRTSKEIVDSITKLAESMDRSRNWVVESALKSYIDLESWQVEGVREAILQADSGDLVSHEELFSEIKKKKFLK